MSNFKIEIKRLDKILEKTIEALRNSKQEVYDIAENARCESNNLQKELNELKEKAKELIEYVELLEQRLKEKKHRLMLVNKHHDKYTQEDFKKAYQEADSIFVELAIKREQEQYLIKRRNELEVRIRNTLNTIQKADRLHSHLDVALSYLTGDFQQIAFEIDNIHQRQLIGLKIIQAQEEERQRVARDIHDGPAQSMSNVVLKAELCEKLISVDLNKALIELQKLKEIVRDSLQDIRKIIYDLRPMSLDDLGLIPTLQRYVYNFREDTGIHVTFKTVGAFNDIRPAVSLTVFRIVQEALSNILKHAGAENVAINLEFSEDKIILHIYDDGIGFNIDEINQKSDDINSGFGIINMRERVELLGGDFEIKSEPGRGTAVNICIPLLNEEGVSVE